jgi:hypothetical protein
MEACLHGFEGFGGFHASGDNQLSRHIGVKMAQAVVGSAMERHIVVIVALPSIPTHGIEALGRLHQGIGQDVPVGFFDLQF